MKKMTPEELEKFIHGQLRGLPHRTAPRSLESRVLSAIEQRASIPWYHQSWSHWPAAAQVAFLIFATAITIGVIASFYLVMKGVDMNSLGANAGSRFAVFGRVYDASVWVVDFVSRSLGNIPRVLLYGTAVVLAALYAAFFSIGAAAYRTLYRRN